MANEKILTVKIDLDDAKMAIKVAVPSLYKAVDTMSDSEIIKNAIKYGCSCWAISLVEDSK
jgi:hypothetical protein